MKTLILIGLALGLAATGCDKDEGKPADTHSAANAPADNTKKNERDRNTDALTPGDQGTSDADIAITQKIRQGVVKDSELSMNAKNIKIITVGAVVTLRGPVKSAKEKADIGALAQRTDGVKSVDNQLEIAAN